MREDPEIMTAIGALWPELSPQQVLADLSPRRSGSADAAPDLTDDAT